MNTPRNKETLTRALRKAGLRPTRQRLSLAQCLFANGDRHVTAEGLYAEAVAAGYPVSLATVYNTLHQFTDAGLLRQVMVDTNRSYFDSNTSDHHHYFHEETGELVDIPSHAVTVGDLPNMPEGAEVSRVEVVVRVHQRAS